MPEVSFYFNVPHRQGYACRWLRRALREPGVVKPIVVVADGAESKAFDQLLWTFDPVGFVPHVRAVDVHALTPRLASTPIRLVESLEGADAGWVLNLGPGVPQGVERFDHVIEIVSRDEDDRRTARDRWKAYKALGFNMKQQEVDA